jgi:hypothetical protein
MIDLKNTIGLGSKYNNALLPNLTPYTKLEFEESHLVCYRTLPFSFSLTSTARGAMARDVRIFYNSNVSRQGAKEAITALRDYAIEHVEKWTKTQLQAVAGTQTLFIVYNSETDMKLDFSKDILTIEQIQEENERAQIFVSYDISDVGLINLVNELLNFL